MAVPGECLYTPGPRPHDRCRACGRPRRSHLPWP
jgi:hypothetical protein